MAERVDSHCSADETARLFNHVVGPSQKRGRDFQAKSLGGLEIKDKLKPSWLLYRQLSRPRPFKNPIHITRRTAHHVESVLPIAQEAAAIDESAFNRHCGQPELGCEATNPIASKRVNC